MPGVNTPLGLQVGIVGGGEENAGRGIPIEMDRAGTLLHNGQCGKASLSCFNPRPATPTGDESRKAGATEIPAPPELAMSGFLPPPAGISTDHPSPQRSRDDPAIQICV